MRYGIIVGGRVTEPVTIPQDRESDAQAWLEVMFPGYTGWVHVSDDAVAGATYSGEGSSTNPTPVTSPAVPKELSKTAFRELCYSVLGALAVPSGTALEKYKEGLSLFTGYLEECRHSENVALRGLEEHFRDAPVFVKERVDLFFAMLVDAGTVSIQQAGAVVASWPNQS